MKNWHQSESYEVLDQLGSDAHDGLEEGEVPKRLAQYGANELIDRGTKSPWKILWEQMTGVMVLILIASAIISILLGEYKDSLVILIIVILNAILGFTQEFKAEQAMAALKKMAVPHVRVRRAGHTLEISARDLVPGDIVLIEAGSAIPADGRLIEAANLRVQESVLTGESQPVDKFDSVIAEEHPPLGDRHNMVFMGTAVTYGRGKLVVVETGMDTQLGQIAEMIQSVDQEQTPLQRRLEQLGKGLALAALGIVALVFSLGVLRGEPLELMFMTAISMAVAAVPEGLPAVVTIALAIGAQRMLKRNALIRKLPAVETLGSVTVIASDKTGTLTENRMKVTVLDVAGDRIDLQERVRSYSPTINPYEAAAPTLAASPSVALLLAGGALCNDAVLEPALDRQGNEAGGYISVGDPTEGALVIAAAQAGLWKAELEEMLPRVAEQPFDSQRKRMSTIHLFPNSNPPAGLQPVGNRLNGHKHLVFTKGAVDSLLEITAQVWVDDHEEPLNEQWLERIQTANNRLAQKGMRVLGVGYRPWAEGGNSTAVEEDLVFVGMVGIIDPARPEVKAAVETTRTAGVRPIMITGDHPLTAMHIARDLGIANGEAVMTGRELAQLSVDELKTRVEQVSVFARVSPEHKLKIVEALQEKGQIVAMTGDGVNDAPALKRADIGVAMGITGTDVSKEASDMVLLDDNFATIVAAVEEGRRIYDNIRKFIKYTMTSNAGEIWVMLLAPFLGMPLPLLPLQILWINLVTDGLPGLALAVEPTEQTAMRRPPHPPQESIFGRGMARDILWIGLLMGLVSLLVGLWGWRNNLASWQTIVFTTLTLSQMGNAFAIRSERFSLFQLGIWSNKPLLGAVLLTFFLQIAVIYTPFLQEIFNTVPLSASELLISLALSGIVFCGVEIQKWLIRRKVNT